MMNPQIYFAIVFFVLAFLIFLFDRKYGMLRDISTATKKPYSFSRVQLGWWIVIVVSAFAAIIMGTGLAPTLWPSTLILLGISAATTAAAKVSDISDKKNTAGMTSQNSESQGFFLDILSDNQGVSVSRFQTVIFNLIFGIWFIFNVWYKLDNLSSQALRDAVMPLIERNNLILIGLSSGTYAALKTTENK